MFLKNFLENRTDQIVLDSKIDWDKILVLSFSFFISISQRISTILIILLFLFSLRNIKNFKLDKQLLSLALFYVIYVLSLLYSSEMQMSIIEKKASFLIFPLIFMLNSNMKKVVTDILRYFVLGTIVALLICEIVALYNSFNISSFVLDTKISSNLTLLDSIVKEKNFFFSYQFSKLHQTVYFGMYLLFASTILIYLKPFNHIFRYLCLLFLTIGLFQILNKAALLIFIILIITFVYTNIQNNRNALIVAILFLLIGSSIFIFNPRFKTFNRNFKIHQSELVVKDFKKMPNNNPQRINTRFILWVSSLELIRENPVLGIGAGGSHQRLYERFAIKRQWYDKSEKYHAHNQYIQVLLDVGVVGFVIFSFIFVFLIKKNFAIRNGNISMIVFSFLLIVSINFLFESMFERYSGISFFSFFYCTFISIKNQLTNKEMIKH